MGSSALTRVARAESRRARREPRHRLTTLVSSCILCLSVGRLIFFLSSQGKVPPRHLEPLLVHHLSVLPPDPRQQLTQREYSTSRWPRTRVENYHNRAMTGQSPADSSSVLRGEASALPAEQQEVPNEHGGVGQLSDVDRHMSVTRAQRGEGASKADGAEGGSLSWGQGMRVLIFTMDSLTEAVTRSKQGGAAGEIIIRESLTRALLEAGVEVEVATSDLEFERRADKMNTYDALVVDPWTWAEAGWRMKPQLQGRQHKMLVLDFFGSDKPRENLGVPLPQHLTAFPVRQTQSQGRTFLGYVVEGPAGVPLGKPATKRRQGVIWGKTAASLRGATARDLISALADMVQLHSTISPEDALFRHDNIVYHGHLSQGEWHSLLRESRFIIGLGHPLSGPSAVDAVAAGCTYLNPVFSRPMKDIYDSQHPFLAQNVGEPYVCSFEQQDINGALECARRALEQDLPPLVPDELTKDAHASRVQAIFEPMVKTPLLQE